MEQLPPGWIIQHDQQNRPYYVNTATGTSQWVPPLSPRCKQIAMQITSSFEHGTTELKYDQAEKVDERGYTAGIAGFTTGSVVH